MQRDVADRMAMWREETAIPLPHRGWPEGQEELLTSGGARKGARIASLTSSGRWQAASLRAEEEETASTRSVTPSATMPGMLPTPPSTRQHQFSPP